METIQPTERTQVRRLPKRGVYDRDQIYSILDEGFICHIGFTADGQTYVVPTGYARSGDRLYIHGSAASRMLRTAASEVDLCLTVTIVDGFVLARSVFHHSMNYRSVMVLGRARPVTETAEKMHALRAFTNHIARDRWEEARQPTEQELKATSVLALPIDECSAKVRTGGPNDDEDDYQLPIWAGVVPVHMQLGAPADDGRLLPGVTKFDARRVRKSAEP